MKKLIAVLLCLTLAVAMVACGNKKEETPEIKNLEGTAEEIIASIQEAHGAMELPLMTMALDLSDLDGVTMNTGLTSVDNVKEIAISEGMMGQACSLVIVRANSPKDAAAIAQEMYNKIDTRKWVCVGADEKIVAGYGDTVMLIMLDSQLGLSAQSYLDAFKTVCGGKLDFTI